MNRSYDYSFVQFLDDAHDIPTIPTRSLRQHSATLAARPLYAPGNYILNTAASSGPSYLHEDAAYSTAHCLLQDHIPGDGDHDLQSNIWYQQIATPERNFWHRVSAPMPTPVSVTPTRPTLAGLGITFGQPQDVAFSLRHPTAQYVNKPQDAATIANPPLIGTRPRKRKASVLYEDDAPMAIDPIPIVNTSEETAYSTCPSQEYAAQSLWDILEDPSPFCMSYSPTDDVLMLVNTTPLPDDMMDDLPPSFTMPTPDLGPKSNTADRMMMLDSPCGDDENPMVGIIADVNFRAAALAARSPVMCVNPADICGPVDVMNHVKMEEDANMDQDVPMEEPNAQVNEKIRSRWASPDMNANFPDDAVTAIVSVLAASAKEETANMQEDRGMPAPALPQHMGERQGHKIHPPAFPSRSAFGLGIQFASPAEQLGSSGTSRSMLSGAGSRVPLAPISTDTTTALVQHRQAPVLNAHEGVELDDLRMRAESFRLLNPGCELDKTFLQAFAGRLSERGELLPEFRCYVKGCVQRNKRRDHILVHVGSHVEHRPFQCPQCGMRFLRKNECKRHMSSHGGFKPFTCTLCAPYQAKSFVRQDLLKRHMKVTHGVMPEHWPDRRRRAKVERGGVESPVLEDLYYPEDDCMMDM